MNTYLISYDLKGPETSADYKNLIDHIKSYQYWCKPLESFWLIRSARTASQVRDALKPHVDGNDKVLVINVTSASWASLNLTPAVVDWIKTSM